jgi:glutamine synthetase
LWWSFAKKGVDERSARETFEYRAPDPLADAYLLFAGIALAVNHGLENSERALKIADDLHVERVGGKRKTLGVLPRSCSESAKNLRKDRRFYEADGVFPRRLVDKTVDELQAYEDEDSWKNLVNKPEKVNSMLRQYLHYG